MIVFIISISKYTSLDFVEDENIYIRLSDVYASAMRFYVDATIKLVVKNPDSLKSSELFTLPYNFNPSSRIISPKIQKASNWWKGAKDMDFDVEIILNNEQKSCSIEFHPRSETVGTYQYLQAPVVPHNVLYGETNFIDVSLTDEIKAGDTLIIHASYNALFKDIHKKL